MPSSMSFLFVKKKSKWNISTRRRPSPPIDRIKNFQYQPHSAPGDVDKNQSHFEIIPEATIGNPRGLSAGCSNAFWKFFSSDSRANGILSHIIKFPDEASQCYKRVSRKPVVFFSLIGGIRVCFTYNVLRSFVTMWFQQLGIPSNPPFQSVFNGLFLSCVYKL